MEIPAWLLVWNPSETYLNFLSKSVFLPSTRWIWRVVCSDCPFRILRPCTLWSRRLQSYQYSVSIQYSRLPYLVVQYGTRFGQRQLVVIFSYQKRRSHICLCPEQGPNLQWFWLLSNGEDGMLRCWNIQYHPSSQYFMPLIHSPTQSIRRTFDGPNILNNEITSLAFAGGRIFRNRETFLEGTVRSERKESKLKLL